MSLLRVARAARSTILQQRVACTPLISLRQAGSLLQVPKETARSEEQYMSVGGRQHEEYLLQLEGVGGFNDQPAVGPFGTIAAPVRIYSSFHSRIAGCKGGDDSKHRVMWFELKAGAKHVCSECGQVFQLVTPNDGQAHH